MSRQRMGTQTRIYCATLALLLLAGGAMHLVQRELYSQPVTPLAVPLSEFPRQIGAWQAVDVGLDEEIESVLHLQDHWSATYRHPDDYSVSVLIGYYADESIAKLHQPTVCYPSSGWTLLREEQIMFPGDAPVAGQSEMNLLTVVRGEQRQLVLYFFRLPGKSVAEPSMAKWYYLRQAFKGDLSRSMIKVQFGIQMKDSVEETMAGVEPLLKGVLDRLNIHLGPAWQPAGFEAESQNPDESGER